MTLEYGRARRSWHIPRRMVRGLLLGGMGGLIAFSIWFGRFQSRSICFHCLQIQHTTQWQVPWTELTYWRSERTTPTPLSQAMAQAGLVTGTIHDWHFIQGSGNGTFCALGDGHHLLTPSQDPGLAHCLQAVAAHEPPGVVAEILRRLRDRDLIVPLTAYASDCPPEAVTNADRYHAWKQGRPIEWVLDLR